MTALSPPPRIGASTGPRGYVLLIVILGGLILSSLALSMLTVAMRDKTEANQQVQVVRAVYAAEGSVVDGVAKLNDLVRESPSPSVADLHAIEPATFIDSMISPTEFQIDYVDPLNNYEVLSAAPKPDLALVAEGQFAGLVARQIPIQVLASAVTPGGATASIADIMRMDQIPVFQFALFFDHALEFYYPEASTIGGRVHSNAGIYFGQGASAISINGDVTTAGRIQLRNLSGKSSSKSNSPTINSQKLECDNAADAPLACPTASWLSWMSINRPQVRDEAHAVPELNLPTGLNESTFTERVLGVPDLCGIDESTNAFVPKPGVGAELSADWHVIDVAHSEDNGNLKEVKYAHRASIRVIDGQWEKKSSSGFESWFRQGDGSEQSNCVYYGYSPDKAAGSALKEAAGVPAIRDVRFWDFQDRQMRRVLAVDIERLTTCLQSELESSASNGVLYFGETTSAKEDNWGISPDDAFYELNGGSCDERFLNLPHYLRGQLATGVTAVKPLPAEMPSYLANDDVSGAARLDNPYYPAKYFCSAAPGIRNKGLGDGPLRLPQGNGNGKIEQGKNELVESGVLLMNAERVPNRNDGSRDVGFTFATNAPVYLQGDFNTKIGTFGKSYEWGKVPASIASDAMTYLSNQFNWLQQNPYAPVGPLAVWQTISEAGAAKDAQRASGSRRWSMMEMGRPEAKAVPAEKPERYDALDTSLLPASPAPCVNLARELALRRFVDPLDNLMPLSEEDGGSGALAFPSDGAIAPRDYLRDLSSGPMALATDAGSSTTIMPGGGFADLQELQRAMNAFVAFAPLEHFLDLSMFLNDDATTEGYASIKTLPSGRNDREVTRDWMRCTLKSDHHLMHRDQNSESGLKYSGTLAPTVRGVTQPQPYASKDPQWGMKQKGGAEIDVTYLNMLGADGWAPSSTDSVFRVGGVAFFTRDRSSLDDPNGGSNPATIDEKLSNLKDAASGDPLAINAAILTGTTWPCLNEMPSPAFGSDNPRSDDASGIGSGTAWGWAIASGDEGLYGAIRYMESWHEVNHGGYPSTGSQGAIDFYINGSIVILFHSRESRGRHVTNQGFHPYMVSGCSGMDYHMVKDRNCRLNPGFEYAWEAAHRGITFDTDLTSANGLPPAVPLVVNYNRLRWMRR